MVFTWIFLRPLLIASIAITSLTGIVALGWQLDTAGILSLYQETSQNTVLSLKHRQQTVDVEKILHLNVLSFQLFMFLMIWLWFAWGGAIKLSQMRKSARELNEGRSDD
jgi:hypothetical protein